MQIFRITLFSEAKSEFVHLFKSDIGYNLITILNFVNAQFLLVFERAFVFRLFFFVKKSH